MDQGLVQLDVTSAVLMTDGGMLRYAIGPCGMHQEPLQIESSAAAVAAGARAQGVQPHSRTSTAPVLAPPPRK